MVKDDSYDRVTLIVVTRVSKIALIDSMNTVSLFIVIRNNEKCFLHSDFRQIPYVRNTTTKKMRGVLSATPCNTITYYHSTNSIYVHHSVVYVKGILFFCIVKYKWNTLL